MNVGRLDRRIRLQAPEITVDANGQENPVWPPEGGIDIPVWAQRIEEEPRERIRAGRIEERAAVIYRMYRRDLTGNMRVLDDGEVYQLSGSPRQINSMFIEVAAVKVS